jgi:beta-glucosidase
VGNDAAYSEGLLVGYRCHDARNWQPLLPFGHGLSYTTFAYSALRIVRLHLHLVFDVAH